MRNKLGTLCVVVVVGVSLLFAASASASAGEDRPAERRADGGTRRLSGRLERFDHRAERCADARECDVSGQEAALRRRSLRRVHVGSTSVSAALNSSYPSGQSWNVDVNNAGGFSTTTSPANSLTFGEVFCPTKTTRTFGGGVFSNSASTGVNIDRSFPINDGHGITSWAAYMANATASTTSFTVYAICRPNLKGYAVKQSTPAAEPAGAQQEAEPLGADHHGLEHLGEQRRIDEPRHRRRGGLRRHVSPGGLPVRVSGASIAHGRRTA
jgi:hypothetical protein